MSLPKSIALSAFRMSAWASGIPGGTRTVAFVLALALATAAVAFNHQVAYACPYGGGGSCGG